MKMKIELCDMNESRNRVKDDDDKIERNVIKQLKTLLWKKWRNLIKISTISFVDSLRRRN